MFLITLNTICALHLEEHIMMSLCMVKNYPSKFFFSLRQVVFLEVQYSPRLYFVRVGNYAPFIPFLVKATMTKEYKWVYSNLE